MLATEEMLERTDTEWGPWTIVEAIDWRHSRAKIFQTLIAALDDRAGLEPVEKAAPGDHRLRGMTSQVVV